MIPKNKRERIVYDELVSQGYEVYHKGYPDFLAYKSDTNELLFIEVKKKQKKPSLKMGLSDHQRRVIDVLRKFIEVKIVYVP